MRIDMWTRFAVGAVLAAGLIVGAATIGYAQAPLGLFRYEDNDGNHWLTGCVEDDLAEHLVAHAAFDYGSPALILCVEGYSAVAKQLGH